MSARIWAGTLIIAGAALAARPAAPVASATPAAVQDQTTTLDDQSELALTVYNSDIALVRDVRQLQLARGTASLRFMDIAATVNPATVHFRSLTEPSRVSVLEQNYEYRPARARQTPPQVRRPRRDARPHAAGGRLHRPGGGDRPAPQLQHRAGVAHRQRDRHRHARRSHPLPRAARDAVLAAHAHLDRGERRCGAPPRGGVVPGRQAGLERGLRPHGVARRQGRGRRRLGDAHQQQRHGVPERQAAAGGRRSESRAAGPRQDGGAWRKTWRARRRPRR